MPLKVNDDPFQANKVRGGGISDRYMGGGRKLVHFPLYQSIDQLDLKQDVSPYIPMTVFNQVRNADSFQ